MLIDGEGNLLTRSDRMNEELRSVGQISGDEQVGPLRLAAHRITSNQSTIVERRSARVIYEREIHRLADGDEDMIAFDDRRVVLIKQRREAAILVEYAQTLLKLNSTYMPVRVRQYRLGAETLVTQATFFSPLDDFNVIGRHLFEGF